LAVFAVLGASVGLAHAGIVEDVRMALAANNLSAAQSEVESYRAHYGATPELIEAISWIGRAALDADQLDLADNYAKQASTLATAQLKSRAVDAEPHLPLGLGAAIEVHAQVLAARGQRAQALALLQSALQRYRSTSIRPRIQKNINLLTLTGRPAHPLVATQHLGPAPKNLAQLKGSPALLFFWAHWCSDCKYEGPIIMRLRSEFPTLQIIAPTQYYGYAAQGQDASPDTELAWIERVWEHFYPGLVDLSVPVSKMNFDVYGASTTPTLVLINRQGLISLYHPGVMPYEELRAAIEKASGK
jgi:thiol-disulfide isomerase/thioredoxin